jgi:uncharacterized membrane protein YeaQ/YmgE (transglycosylase-associated protein family)
MQIVAWLVFGLVVGLLARTVVPGRDHRSALSTIVIGILGAVVGNWLGSQLGWGTIQGFDLRSFGLAVLGGMIVLAGARMLRR